MKMKSHQLIRLWLGMLLLILAACSKNSNDFLQKEVAIQVNFKGYNASTEELAIKIDNIRSSRTIEANKTISQGESYLFSGNKNTVKLTLSEKTTGKVVLEREIKKTDGPVTLNFLYMDGKVGDMPEKPAIEDGKIKLTYMFIPSETNYSEPVDFVIGKYYLTPQVFEELTRIKNVKPNEFSTVATIPTFSTARQDYNGVMTTVSFLVRICKAGTNIPYTDGTSYTWNALSSTAPKPSSSTASSKLYIFSEGAVAGTMRFFTRLDY